MSLLHPQNAEDEMAQVPLFCCLVPLLLVIAVGVGLAVWLL